MKVLILSFLLVSAVTAGSGPYLPSGWRPAGPAFLLPTEIKETSPIPLKDSSVQEASGTDALREYGPPNFQPVEVSQDLTVQALPNEVTEQPFVVLKAKFNDAEVINESEDIATTLLTDEILATTESQALAEETTAIIQEYVAQGRSLDIDAKAEIESITETVQAEVIEVTTEKNTEELTEKIDELKTSNEIISSNAAATVEEPSKVTADAATEKLVEVIEQKVEDAKQDSDNAGSNVVTKVEEKIESVIKAAEAIKNIEDTLIKLENEAKAEIKTVSEAGPITPEGFLEYGPPGFQEYGPPKVALLSSAASNEVRRRRFSPRLSLIPRRH